MSVEESHHNTTYKDALSPVVRVTTLFNSGAITKGKGRLARYLEKAVFLLLVSLMAFVTILVAFALPDAINIYVQASINVIPLVSMISGHFIFQSNSFKEFLHRGINQKGSSELSGTSNTGNGYFNNNNNCEGDHYIFKGSFKGLSRFLRIRAIKTCFYPMSLILYQWLVYLILFYAYNASDYPHLYSFVVVIGSIHLVVPEQVSYFYYIFWTAAMYLTGFIAWCFILVIDIHKLETKSFLCLIGNAPMIQKTSNYRTKYANGETQSQDQYQPPQPVNTSNRVSRPGLFFRVLAMFTGFLTLGFLELDAQPPTSSCENCKNWGRGADSGSTSGLSTSQLEDGKEGTSSEKGSSSLHAEHLTPKEASKILARLMTSLESNSSLFKPFLVLLTFFSVTVLTTFIVAMATSNTSPLNNAGIWWTFLRAFFWFLLAIRLLWTVATMTNTLSLIIPHIYYLRSVGELRGDRQEWDDFLKLAETFQLGSRTYGFPLTLSQVASIVAVVNFSFLVVLSLMSK